MRILHIGDPGFFARSLFEYLHVRGEDAGHAFLGWSRSPAWPADTVGPKLRRLPRWRLLFAIPAAARRADKVVCHSLVQKYVLAILFLFPSVRRKTCWILWGHDLYQYRRANQSLGTRVVEAMRRRVIPGFAQVASATPGDGELLREVYGYAGPYLNVFTYPNSIVRPPPVPVRAPGAPLRVLVGHSAHAENEHETLLRRLLALDDGRMRIVCPLSYGDRGVAQRISGLGHGLFGDRFEPLLEFMPYDDYLRLLAGVDVAVFGNDRQKAMANVRNLLGMGKKVFMQPGTTAWKHMQSLGLRLFDVNALELSPEFPEAGENIRRIRETYSPERFQQGLDALFAPLPGA